MKPRHSNRFRSTPNAGFTLVELVMVVVIVATLAAIALPRYAESTRRYQVSLAARRIATDIAFAQSRARATSSSKSIVFNVADSTYEIPGERALDHAAGAYAVRLGDPPYQATLDAVNFDNFATAQFDGFGKLQSSGTIRVSVEGFSRTVTVDANGRVVVQ